MHVFLKEWEQVGFDEVAALRGLELSPAESALAASFAPGLEIDEQRRGLRLRATSFVGRVTIGPLVVTIEPKIGRADLLRLFEYAYELDDLDLYDDTTYSATDLLFVDLIVRRLLREVMRLRERGLHRAYVRVAEELLSPRGRLDPARLIRTMARSTVSVPCVHHPRDVDTPLNQVLKAGLHLAGRIAVSGQVRLAALRAAAGLEEVSARALSANLLARVQRAMDRRVRHYAPAVNLIAALRAGTSLDLDGEDRAIETSGFLFDMNRFWQALLGRLLRENLDGIEVVEDRALSGALRYATGFGHPVHRAPTMRPDFLLSRERRALAVLDAKYRDLWQRELPSAMLYQLAVYATVQGTGGRSAILYPAHSAHAREVRVEVCGLGGRDTETRATVALRPVHVARLVDAVRTRMPTSARKQWVMELAGFQRE